MKTDLEIGIRQIMVKILLMGIRLRMIKTGHRTSNAAHIIIGKMQIIVNNNNGHKTNKIQK